MLSILSEAIPATAGVSQPSQGSTPARDFLRDTLEVPNVTIPEEAEASPNEIEEFEIVMGRRQVASVLFVATVVVAVFSGVAYLAGKSIAAKRAPGAAQAVVTNTAAKAAVHEAPIPLLDATIVSQTAAAAELTPLPVYSEPPGDAPLFADPQIGATYIQMAAVERGIAAIFADGLRRHGFSSFVAPGPSDKMYRVLIGPLKNNAEYTRVKETLDQIGLTTFARKYQQ